MEFLFWLGGNHRDEQNHEEKQDKCPVRWQQTKWIPPPFCIVFSCVQGSRSPCAGSIRAQYVRFAVGKTEAVIVGSAAKFVGTVHVSGLSNFCDYQALE